MTHLFKQIRENIAVFFDGMASELASIADARRAQIASDADWNAVADSYRRAADYALSDTALRAWREDRGAAPSDFATAIALGHRSGRHPLVELDEYLTERHRADSNVVYIPDLMMNDPDDGSWKGR